MAQSNAERQRAWRNRRRHRRKEIDLNEFAALSELLDSAASAGALIDRYGDLRSVLQAPAAEIRSIMPTAEADRVVRRLAALRTAVQIVTFGRKETSDDIKNQ